MLYNTVHASCRKPVEENFLPPTNHWAFITVRQICCGLFPSFRCKVSTWLGHIRPKAPYSNIWQVRSSINTTPFGLFQSQNPLRLSPSTTIASSHQKYTIQEYLKRYKHTFSASDALKAYMHRSLQKLFRPEVDTSRTMTKLTEAPPYFQQDSWCLSKNRRWRPFQRKMLTGRHQRRTTILCGKNGDLFHPSKLLTTCVTLAKTTYTIYYPSHELH